jgi:uncharacterized membrane protein
VSTAGTESGHSPGTTGPHPWGGRHLLPERWRLAMSSVGGLVAGVLWLHVGEQPDGSAARVADTVIVVLLVYLTVYLAVTVLTFSRAPDAAVAEWAGRASRGSLLQRYLLGTAPGPGVSIVVSTVSLVVAIGWLPRAGDHGTALPAAARLALGVLLLVAAWWVVVVSFTVAYQADDLVEDGQALQFPGPAPRWSDYLYFGVAVSGTFGTTDVTVASPAMRRTITLHAVLAFVFDTVILGAVVGVLVP